jgi:hypothetical protein
LGVVRLIADRQAARLQKRDDERLQMPGVGVAEAGLPPLHGAAAHADARGELTLSQAGATAMAEQKTLKRLPGSIRAPVEAIRSVHVAAGI